MSETTPTPEKRMSEEEKSRGEVVAKAFLAGQRKLVKFGVNEDWRIDCSADMLEHHLAVLINSELAAKDAELAAAKTALAARPTGGNGL